MKGDFSNIIQGEGYDALLVQQGRPLLDSQINGISLAMLEGRENSLAELHELGGKVFFPKVDGKEVKVEIVIEGEKHFKIPPVAYIDGLRAKLDSGSLLKVQADQVLYVDVYEETFWIQPDSRRRFSDPAIANSDSVRFQRRAVYRAVSNKDWNLRIPKKPNELNPDEPIVVDESGKAAYAPEWFVAAPLFIKTDRELGNSLYRFMIAESDTVNNRQMLWSKNNAGFVIPVALKKNDTHDAELHVEQNKVYLPHTSNATDTLRIGQYVEFITAAFKAPDEAFIQVKKITEVGNNYVVVESENDLGLGLAEDKASVLRIWDGVGLLKKAPSEKEKDKEVLSIGFDGFKIELPLELDQIKYEKGQHWIVPIRNGKPDGDTFDRRLPVIRRGKVGVIKPDGNGFVWNETGHFDRAVAAKTQHIAPTKQQEKRGEPISHFLNEVYASKIFRDPKTLAVSRWMASVKLDEIAKLSKSDLRTRIKRDCNEKDYDEQSLETDLEMIIARRDELLPSRTYLT